MGIRVREFVTGQIRGIVLLACVTCLFSGCTSYKSSINYIDVPKGLSKQQVEFAILASLANQPPPEGLSPELEITDRALKAWFGFGYNSVSGDRAGWFLEGREGGQIFAGLQRSSYYLRVAIDYSPQRVSFHVVDSRNLRETKYTIHRTAVRWIQDLEIAIRRSLGQLSVY